MSSFGQIDMDQLGSTSNHQCSDPGTSVTAAAPTPWWPRPPGAAGADAETTTWSPRLLSWYARTESAHWSRRLDADVCAPDAGPRPAAVVRPQAAAVDYYGREDADAAFLRRRPASFAVFGKPGLPADRVAAELSARWGCAHVSPAIGLAAAADGPVTADLRRGLAVNAAAGGAGRLFGLLGLDSHRVRERGYVLTGLPRHDPNLSARAQMDAVFAANPPNVLIYMSCPDADLHAYRDGLILESAEHDHPTQTLHHRADRTAAAAAVGHVRWYGWPRRDSVAAEVDAAGNRATHWLSAVDEVVKRFDPAYVITVDGRRPVDETFRAIEARLLSLPLQRTVTPETVPRRAESTTALSGSGDESYESEPPLGVESETMTGAEEEEGVDEEEGATGHGGPDGPRVPAEQARLWSEFGRLCPVSLSRREFRAGDENHCLRFMGKSYRFAGPDELRSFRERPRRYLAVSRPGLPVRAVFYGPRALAGPAAKAVGRFFGHDVIDVDHVRRAHAENARRTYVSAVVRSVLGVAREVTRIRDGAPREMAAMRNAIGEWMRLYFGAGPDAEHGTRDGESERAVFEDGILDNESRDEESAKAKRLTSLKNYFESYDTDFMYDLNACKQTYEKPETLIKYFQNMSKRNRNIFRSNFLNENSSAPLQLLDIIVDTVRIKNKENENWIIVNAPLDFLLVKKLSAEALNPIQMVFFRDTDPMHNVLLAGEISDVQYNNIIWETIENVKNGMRHGTTVERLNYPEYVKKTENTVRRDTYQFEEDEDEDTEDHYEEDGNNITHDLLMEVILPEITERLDRYTEYLFVQWHTLQKNICQEMKTQYVDSNVIECKSNVTPTDTIKILIEDTLYCVKRSLSENVYDVSTNDDTVPTVGRYDGDTSVYCPVMFADGKLSVGSKRHMAVYQNRYYYMKSDRNFKAFVANPNKYASFTAPPDAYPKPKISLYCPFGMDVPDAFKNVLDTFDLTLIDSHEVFKNNVLPEGTPMLGKMYEEPTLRNVFDEHFSSENNDKDYVNVLREYVDGVSAYLDDEDWTKMNSVFFRSDEGVCYKNYPANVTELAYLKEKEMMPDFFVEVVADERAKHEHAKKAITENWSNYRRALLEKAIARDETTRRKDVAARSAMFKNELAELKRKKKTDAVRARLRRMVEKAAETAERGANAIMACDSPTDQSALWSSGDGSTPSPFESLRAVYAELTLKRKKIILKYELNVADFADLDDLAALERIDETMRRDVPAPEWSVSKCFTDDLKPCPSDAAIRRHVDARDAALAGMRALAESSGVPWFTVPAAGDLAATSDYDELARALRAHAARTLETAYAVDVDTAERMLCAGEAHLGRFGRGCPVHAYRRPDSVPRFYADLADGRACPVVYRKYVYYASGPEHRDEFVRRPLEYARRPCDAATQPVPLRVAVLGPPHSGKSRCARHLCARHGLQPIRIDEPLVRAYFAECRWTAGAAAAWARLHHGGALDDVALNAIVLWAAQGARAVAQGYALVGYPVTENQFRLLDDAGVLLHRVFVLTERADDDDHGPTVPPAALSEHRREVWTREAAAGPWLADRYGDAVVTVAAADDRGRRDRTDASLSTCVRSLREYGERARAGRPCRLAGLPVPGPERRAKMTAYLDACPVCRTDRGLCRRPPRRGPAGDRLVQYREHLYYVCPRHQDAFTGDARRYADAAPEAPEPLAEPLTAAAALDPCSFVRGLRDTCLVCALTGPAYRRGDVAFAAKYAQRAFLFCSAACRRKFALRPSAYAAHETRAHHPRRQTGCDAPLRGTPVAAVRGLPALGYLEQTVGEPVARALVLLSAAKPVYPGLSPEASAAVFVGLCVGAHGENRRVNAYYRDAFRRFIDACRVYKSQVFRLKSLA